MGKQNQSTIATNRQASYQFELGTRYEAGIALHGWEVVAIRQNQVQLSQSFVSLKKGEAWLMAAHISPLSTSTHENADPLRARKLLLKRIELNKLIGLCEQKGMTLVPTKLYFKQGKIKLEVAVAKGKKAHDKRRSIKERDERRYEASTRKHSGRNYDPST